MDLQTQRYNDRFSKIVYEGENRIPVSLEEVGCWGLVDCDGSTLK